MAVAQTDLALDAPAPDFRLPATHGRSYALKDVAGRTGRSSSSSATIALM